MLLGSEIITSPQNKYVSLARGLANKKNREKEKKFRFDGVKLLCEAIKKGARISFVLAHESEWSSVVEKAESLYGIKEKDIDCPVVFVEKTLFERLSEEMAPEGIICVAEYEKDLHRIVGEEELLKYDLEDSILILESVRDPQNVGAIVRVAAAFGVDRILMSRDCADIYNSKTLRASMGTLFGTRIDRFADIPFAVRILRENGRRVFAAALERDSIKLGEFEIARGDCVIIGNEGHGLSEDTIKECDKTVFIPMAEGVESLNAATAAAVLVWEFFGSKARR
jgi:TrmH family RNA methyltransferase